MEFNEREMDILQDTSFLLTKAVALQKVEALLVDTRSAIEGVTEASAFDFPPGAVLSGGKVSRGENYLGLPYRILDQPALLTAGDIFALRTMFWWGHFFSVTLHLQGASLERYREGLVERFDRLLTGQYYISVGESPWEYHYGRENYTRLDPTHRAHLQACEFLKLSRKKEIGAWREVPRFAADFLEELLRVLSG